MSENIVEAAGHSQSLSLFLHTVTLKKSKAGALYLCMVCRDIHIFFYQFRLLPQTVMVVLFVMTSCYPLFTSREGDLFCSCWQDS